MQTYMDILTALILGIVQGITEWLPVSSSAHLVILQHFLGMGGENPVLFDAVLHLGTLAAVLLATWKYVIEVFERSLLALKGGFKENLEKDEAARTGWGAVLATVPIVIAGLLFQDAVESAFSSLWVVALMLPVTGIILFFVRGKHGTKKDVSMKNALVIGLFQVFALFPGISRSGITISTGIHSGLERESATRFSFLMAILAIAGAGALQIYKAVGEPSSVDMGAMLTGFLSSFIVGYLAIRALLKIVVTDRFHYFAYYCWALSAVLIAYLLIS